MPAARRTILVALALAALSGPGLVRASGPDPVSCEFKEPDARWVQRALDGWELTRRDFLKLEPRPLPWVVLFDARCVWHIGPTDAPVVEGAHPLVRRFRLGDQPLEIRAQRHRGTVLLPNRVEIPIEVKASTALYRSGRSAFLVMSMPSVWRADKRHAAKPFLDEYLQGVFTHELVHTRQLVVINRRLRQLAGRGDVPPRLNDDVIQSTFHKEPGFGRAVQQESDLMFRAAAASDPATMRDLARKALALKRDRHARYYRAANAPYAEMEELFLTMEGAGQWAAYQLTRARRIVGASDLDALALVRDNRRFWSQDQGLALYLLLDLLAPGWQPQMFDGFPSSPWALLEAALSTPPAPQNP